MSLTRSPFFKTALVGVVFVVLVLYIALFESRRPGPEDKSKEKPFAFDRTKVKELTIAKKDGETIRLVKDPAAGWKMTSPLTVPADPGEVEQILTSLSMLDVEEVVSETGGKPAEFGLETPKFTITVAVEGSAQPLALAIGDRVPAIGGVYARQPGQARIVMVPSYADTTFDRKPFDLRYRTLLHVPRGTVASIEVTGPEGSYALSRQQPIQRLAEPFLASFRNSGWSGLPVVAEDWVFTRPIRTQAGRWSVDGLLGNMESLRFESVAAEEAKDLKTFGLDKPVRTVVLGVAGGGSKTLEIGKPTGEKQYYARDAANSLVGVISGALVDDLAKGVAGLRAKRLLELRVFDTVEFDVQTEGEKRTYVRSGHPDVKTAESYGWKRTVPEAKGMETKRVEDALFALAGVDVLEFIDRPATPDAYGLATPLISVVFRLGPG